MFMYMYIYQLFTQNSGLGGECRFLQLYLATQQTRSSHIYIYIERERYVFIYVYIYTCNFRHATIRLPADKRGEPW